MNGIVSHIYTFGIFEGLSLGDALLNILSTPYAIGLYLAALMLLVAVLTGAVLLALHLIRKDTEHIEKNPLPAEINTVNTDKSNTNTDSSRFSQLTRIDEEIKSLQSPV